MPPVVISYDPKVEGMAGELGLRAVPVGGADFQAEALENQMRELWQNQQEVTEQLAVRTACARDAARRNIELCLEMRGETR